MSEIISFTHLGYNCLAVRESRGPSQHWRGYVKLQDTRWEGEHTWEIPIDVHGGITYHDDMKHLGKDGIWIGFDCAHLCDGKHELDANYRTLSYVVGECEKMVKQLRELDTF